MPAAWIIWLFVGECVWPAVGGGVRDMAPN